MRTALVLLIAFPILATPSHSGAGADPVAACRAVKAKTAGKKASDLLKAFGKNFSKNPDTKLAASVSKAQSKFTKGFTKAESKGACDPSGDAASIEAKVDAAVFDIIGNQVCVCGDGIKGCTEECDGGPPFGAGPTVDCFIGICAAGCTCLECGDGIAAAGEECDDGLLNGTADSCCTPICTWKPASTPCTDTDDNPSTTAGCDGFGTCDQLHLSPSGAFLDPSASPLD